MLIEEEDDSNRDVGDLAFRALIRDILYKVQTIEPGESPPLSLYSHSPPLEAFVTLAFGTETYKSGYINKLDRSLPRTKASITPMHTILARRFSAALTDRTGAARMKMRFRSLGYIGINFESLRVRSRSNPAGRRFGR